jgi:hypothetical protein
MAPAAGLSAAHRHCLATLARGNLVFVQVMLFRKPWRYFCNKALRRQSVHSVTAIVGEEK